MVYLLKWPSLSPDLIQFSLWQDFNFVIHRDSKCARRVKNTRQKTD